MRKTASKWTCFALTNNWRHGMRCPDDGSNGGCGGADERPAGKDALPCGFTVDRAAAPDPRASRIAKPG
jgi:hypothetical protein